LGEILKNEAAHKAEAAYNGSAAVENRGKKY